MVRNLKVTPVTWIGDNEFSGIGERAVRRRDINGIFQDEVDTWAVYGWAKNGNTFFIYTIDQGHIQKEGTLKRDELLAQPV